MSRPPAGGDAEPEAQLGSEDPLLTLTVGKSAFPLYRSTVLRTLANDSRTYVFTPQVEGINRSFVAIILPEATAPLGASADLASLQNQLELVLVEHGLLKDGFEATADEIAQSVREDSSRIAQRIRDARDQYLAAHAPTTEPAEYPDAVHGIAGGSVSGTQALASVAHGVSGVVVAAAGAVGAWVASTFVPTEPETTERLNAASRGTEDVGRGLSSGVEEIKDALKGAAGDVVENDFGDEARDVLGNVGQSVGNVGAITGDVAAATSGGPIFTAGLMGAASRQEEKQELKDKGERAEDKAD